MRQQKGSSSLCDIQADEGLRSKPKHVVRCCSWRCTGLFLLSSIVALLLLAFVMEKACFPVAAYDQSCSAMDENIRRKIDSLIAEDLASWKPQVYSVKEMVAYVRLVNSDKWPMGKRLSLIHLKPDGR